LGPVPYFLFRSVLKINTSKRRRTGQTVSTRALEGEEEDFLAYIDPGGPDLRAQVRRKRTLAAKKRATKKSRRPSIRTSLVRKLRAAKKRAATAFRNAERDLIALKAQKSRTIFVRSSAIKGEPLEL